MGPHGSILPARDAAGRGRGAGRERREQRAGQPGGDYIEFLKLTSDALRDVLQKMKDKLEFGLSVNWKREEVLAEPARTKDEIASLYEQAQANVEQLQQLDQLKSQFLSMAAHELTTPLTSVLGYLQVALPQEGAEGRGPGG